MDSTTRLIFEVCPMSEREAVVIKNCIIKQQKAENEYNRQHAIAQELRLLAQKSLGFTADQYYSFIQNVL